MCIRDRYRVVLVDTRYGIQERADLRGSKNSSVLSALWNGTCFARSGAGLQGSEGAYSYLQI